MKNKTIIIPDVHGRTFWKECVKEITKGDKVIFLGDYVDPYRYEGVTPEDALEILKEVIAFKKEHNDEVVLLLGNHDFSYIVESMPRCRYDMFNHHEITDLFIENKELFDIIYIDKRGDKTFVFSHSGILPEWIEIVTSRKEEFDYFMNFDNLKDFLNDAMHKNDTQTLGRWLNHVSHYRGGWGRFGSCIWGDADELEISINNKNSKHPKDVYQIVGHTQLREDPIITDKFACLDCRKGFELTNENEIKIIPEKVQTETKTE